MDKGASVPGAQLKKKKKKQKKPLVGPSKDTGEASVSASPRARTLPNAVDATQEDILDVAYWRALIPFLRVGAMDSQSLAKKKGSGSKAGKEILRQQRHKLKEDGYCVAERSDGDERPETLDQELVDKLAFAASVLEYYGWPTTFLTIYDEAWELAQQCQDWMDRITNAHAVSGAHRSATASAWTLWASTSWTALDFPRTAIASLKIGSPRGTRPRTPKLPSTTDLRGT